MAHKRAQRDINEIAASIVEQTTREKNPAAVALGRVGGLKGGKARADSLTKKQRSAIAKQAATEKWKRYYAAGQFLPHSSELARDASNGSRD
jgi:hypothetical protein